MRGVREITQRTAVPNPLGPLSDPRFLDGTPPQKIQNGRSYPRLFRFGFWQSSSPGSMRPLDSRVWESLGGSRWKRS